MITSDVRFGRIAATIPVSDMRRALAFYTGILGMTKTFENGRPTSFAIVTRDAGELHLQLTASDRIVERNVAHLLVDDASKLHDRLVRHGVRIINGLRDEEYGLRDFVFADPDGNRIDVGQRIA